MPPIRLTSRRNREASPGSLRTHDLGEAQAVASEIFGPTRIVTHAPANRRRAAIQAARIGQVLLVHVDYGNPVDVIAESPKPWFVAQTILSGSLRTQASAMHDCGTTLMYLPGNPFQMSLSERCRRLCVIVDSARLRELDLGGAGRSVANRSMPVLDLQSAAGARWRALVDYLGVEMFLRLQGQTATPEDDAGLERWIMSALLACWTPADRSAPTALDDAPAYLGRAVAYIEAHFQEPLSTDQLAAHCGVSARALQLAFMKHKAVSPMQHLKTVRLHRARSALCAEPPASGMVTRIAMDHGFSHLGEFASDYKRAFGESPSETLRRR